MANPTFALLSCHFLFPVYYTLFLTILEISYKARKRASHDGKPLKFTH